MSRMNTRQRLDCLLKQFDTLAKHQGDEVVLNEHEIELLMNQCGFVNKHEIGFYIRSLGEKGFLVPECSDDDVVLKASITIEGYIQLDKLARKTVQFGRYSTY